MKAPTGRVGAIWPVRKLGIYQRAAQTSPIPAAIGRRYVGAAIGVGRG